MHKFVEKNMDKLPEFSSYKKPEKNTVAPNGQPGFVMKQDDFNKVYNTLVSALKPSGPWEHGVTVRVTNLSNKTIDDGTHALVSTRFHRNPIDGAGKVTFEEGVPKGTTSAIHPNALSQATVEPFNPDESA